MQPDHSWDALLNPGAATNYFAAPHRLRPHGTEAVVNAWWLAELSRLCYRGGVDDPARDAFLAGGLATLVTCVQVASIRAMLVRVDTSEESVHVVAFRGTSELRDWRDNLNARPISWAEGGFVHRGFADALDRIWPEIQPRLRTLPGVTFFTGHSLGGALATLAASRCSPTALYTFGSPRVGDERFAETLGPVPAHRFVSGRDLVTEVPPSVGSRPFIHVGQFHHVPFIESAGTSDVPSLAAQIAADRRWFDPHPALAAHAPVNYVAGLYRRLPPAAAGEGLES